MELPYLVSAIDVRHSAIRSPVLWFLLAGAALFALDVQRQNHAENTINITQGDIQRLRDQWQAQSGTPVEQDTLDALVADLIQQRRLTREAIALGLDKQDVIVERRLAQKMRFLTEGLSDEVDFSEPDLEEFFAAHLDDYAEPAKWSFRHIFFSADTRSGQATVDASTLLADIQRRTRNIDDWQKLGAPFIHGRTFLSRSSRELEQLFGNSFVVGLSQAGADKWHGPLSSTYGSHLILIENYLPPRTVALAKVRDAVLYDYRIVQRELAYESYLETLAGKYPVVVQTEVFTQP